MPTDITTTPEKGTTISVPVGTDTRTAASLMDAWQAIGNRINWLEAFVTRIAGAAADVHETGILAPSDSLQLDLSDGHLEIFGNDDFNVYLGGIGGTPGGVQLFCNGLLAGHLFTEGRTGRANRKTLTLASPGTNQSVDPTIYDEIFVDTAVANIDVTITNSPGVPYKKGDHITIHNYSVANTVTVKNPAGSSMGTITAIGSGYIEAVYDGTTWRLGKFKTS